MEEEKKHIDELIATYLTEGLDKNALAELFSSGKSGFLLSVVKLRRNTIKIKRSIHLRNVSEIGRK